LSIRKYAKEEEQKLQDELDAIAAEREKQRAEEKKKDVNPLDALPDSPWNFYDFKTLYVNHPDKRGGGIEELKKQFDPQGYAFWYTHYEKYGTEG